MWVLWPALPAGIGAIQNLPATVGFLAVSFSSLKAAFHCSIVAAWPLPKAALASAYS